MTRALRRVLVVLCVLAAPLPARCMQLSSYEVDYTGHHLAGPPSRPLVTVTTTPDPVPRSPGPNEHAVEVDHRVGDPFRLPDAIEPIPWEYAPEDELVDMRFWNQKAFRHEGQIKVLTSSGPIHYAVDDGWEEIDVNIVAASARGGWEVTKNTVEVYFPRDAGAGVELRLDPQDPTAEPVVVGIAPRVVTMDESGANETAYRVDPVRTDVAVGGNVIRYPVADGFDVDYEVTSDGVKQNLMVYDRPVVRDADHWFGFSETMHLPHGYGLFIEDQQVGHEVRTTQRPMNVRHLITGDRLGEVPPPLVTEGGSSAPYLATFFVRVQHGVVFVTTAVETSWLMDERRTFPLALDPTIKRVTNAGGYCYRYYSNCYSSNYRYFYRHYGKIHYLPWGNYQFTAVNALPSGATPSSVRFKQYISYSNTRGSRSYEAAIMMTCGTALAYTWQIASASCTDVPLSVGMGSGGTAQRKMVSSIWNSPSVGIFSTGTGWKTTTLPLTSSAPKMGGNHIVDAANAGSSIGMTHRNMDSNYYYMYAYNTGSYNSYIEITYSGGTDSTPPSASFIPYKKVSYREGARTFFITLSDPAGIDTTPSECPRLYYSVNGGSYVIVSATSIGTCSTTAAKCRFKAATASISAGDSVDYFWAFQDLALTAGMADSNNLGTEPPGGSGTPDSAGAPSTPYHFEVEHVVNAASARKFVVLSTDNHAGNRFAPSKWFDRQMTYYNDNHEYVFEFDTSACGTGANSCFYSNNDYFYSQWEMQWTETAPSGYNGMGGKQSGKLDMHKDDGGYLSITSDNGPGMNLIYFYDSDLNMWGMVGLGGPNTGIEQPLAGGTVAASARSTYGYTQAYSIEIPANTNVDGVYLGTFIGTFGEFEFKAEHHSTYANWMCVTTNGFWYFFKSNSLNPLCTSSYYNVYSSSYKWSGFALGTGYYGRMADSGEVSYKVTRVAPTPDMSPPNVEHEPLADSHALTRTLSFVIIDEGNPPFGVDVTATLNVGPTLHYTVKRGTVDRSSDVVLLQPSGNAEDRDGCVKTQCTWSYTLTDGVLEHGDTVTYHITARDTKTPIPNKITTDSSTFDAKAPNKVLIVEWHDVGYTSTYTCTFQVRLFDTTNEIEFHYDPSCKASYDYSTVGYQDDTRANGATLRETAGYINGANPHTNNYRISTNADGSHAWETFDLGNDFRELTNYNTSIIGLPDGYPFGYYCASSYYWNTHKAGCDANVDMPDGFTFEYFGQTFNGTDSTNRLMISRLGGMYFKRTSSISPERTMTTWYTNMPDLPHSSNVYSRPNFIAPWWGYYTSYYCYDNSALDCSVRYAVKDYNKVGTCANFTTQRRPDGTFSTLCAEQYHTCDTCECSADAHWRATTTSPTVSPTTVREANLLHLLHRWTMAEPADESLALDTGFDDSDHVLALNGNAVFAEEAESDWVVLANDDNSQQSFLQAHDSFEFEINNDGFTFMAWVRAKSSVEKGCILHLGTAVDLEFSVAGHNDGMMGELEIIQDSNLVVIGNDGTTPFFLPVDQWAHVAVVATAVTLSSSKYTLYRDGTTTNAWTKTSTDVALPDKYTDMTLGRDRNSGFYFNGALRDVRLYDRALPPAKIAAIADEWDPSPYLFGVFVADITRDSTSLDLSKESSDPDRLTGTIPAALGKLTKLEHLDLYGNQLTGTIPDALGKLTKLKHLDLSFQNELTGPIPPELGELTNLTSLSLKGNDFNGTIPDALGKLTKLKELVLSYNKFAAIPDTLWKLTNLQILDFSYQYFYHTGTIPDALGKLTELEELNLYFSNFHGTIPAALGKLTKLKMLYLSRNKLTGVIPHELENLVHIDTLHLECNKLDGCVPWSINVCRNDIDTWNTSSRCRIYQPAPTYSFMKCPEDNVDISKTFCVNCPSGYINMRSDTPILEPSCTACPVGTSTSADGALSAGACTILDPNIGELTHLTNLTLDTNQLTGTIPPQLGELTGLTSLSLSTNQLNGTIPDALGKLTGLTSLTLDTNQLTGTIPPQLGELTGLTWLYLNTNQLNGTIPDALGELASLTTLYLYDNQLTGTIPDVLGELASLTSLGLRGNQLTGTIPDTLGELTDLALLYLHNNQLTGTIPDALGNLANLTSLSLSGNQLTGTIPDALGELAKLMYLYLYGNQLTGTIPDTIGNLGKLRYLSLNDNQLTGTIPDALGELANLMYLYLYDNQLTGTIPDTIGNLGKLQFLYLKDNQLTGTIPDTIGNLGKLRYLYLNDNQLTGTIPDALSGLYYPQFFLYNLFLQNNRLSGCVPVSATTFNGCRPAHYNEHSGYPCSITTDGSNPNITGWCPTQAPTSAPSASPSASPTVVWNNNPPPDT